MLLYPHVGSDHHGSLLAISLGFRSAAHRCEAPQRPHTMGLPAVLAWTVSASTRRQRLRDDKDNSVLIEERLVGRTIDNRYLVERWLGEGGMGVVYRARHVSLNKPVALKILRKAYDEAARKRFIQEAQSASAVEHVNVVAISDFGQINDHDYLVMEFLEGETLTDLISQGATDPLRVSRIGAQIARGLQAVHARGIVHRDLKPDNIFLVERNGVKDIVKIVDFGLAKNVTGPRLTKDGTVVGTAEYISPEQVTGQDTDSRSDQYSLGCILYELLTAQLPHSGESAATLIYKHVYKNPIPPRRRRPDMNISPSLEAVVLRCLAKRPIDRYPNMTAVEQALLAEEQALLVKASGAGPSSPPRLPLRLDRPWLYWAGTVGGGLAILTLFGALLTKACGSSRVVAPPLSGSQDTVVPTRPVAPPARTQPTGSAPVSAVSPPPPDLGVRPDLAPPPAAPSPPVAEADPGGGKRPHLSASSKTLRLTVLPAAASAEVSCRATKVPCKGTCKVVVPDGVTCLVSAHGFESQALRWRQIRAAAKGLSVTLHPRLAGKKK